MVNELCEPIGGRVLIKLELPPKERAGLAMLDVDKGYLQIGTVVQKGPGLMNSEGRRQKMEIKVGDRVVIKKFAGIDIRMNGEDYLMVFYDTIEGLAYK